MRPASIRSQTLRAAGLVIALIIGAFLALAVSLGEAQIYALGEKSASELARAIAARAQRAATEPRAAGNLLHEVIGHDGILAGALYAGPSAPAEALTASAGSPEMCPRTSVQDATADATESASVQGAWCITTPVFRRIGELLCTQPACVLGHLVLAVSTAPAHRVASHLIAAISLMSVLLLAAALLSLWWATGRISAPLREIVALMRGVSSGSAMPEAPEHTGPEEVRTLAAVYNGLIRQQTGQARVLEERVAQRTRDLENATRAIQQSERDRAAFVVQMSHEMRTPLHLIQAQASDAMHELEFWRDGQAARANVNLILRESVELADRVDQVLSLARSGVADDPVHLEPTALEFLRDNLLEKYRPLAAQRKNALTVAADTATVDLDRDKVLQILNNLLDNACKYTSAGAILVRIRIQDGKLVLSVEDTGIGIEPENTEEVWKEFRQAPSTQGSRQGGFGLGLAIVQARTRQLGGTCHLRSAPGQGTTVVVAVPVHHTRRSEPGRERPAAPESARSVGARQPQGDASAVKRDVRRPP